MIGLLLAGIVGLPRAARSPRLPQVDYPTIVVSTFLPGASAETMASARDRRRSSGSSDRCRRSSQMTSVSSFGSSQITLQFTLDRNIDAAEQDVQAAINAASNLLPRTLPTPPTYSKSNPADTPILTLSRQLGHAAARARSTTSPIRSWRRRSRRCRASGSSRLNGGQKPAVRVQVDPGRRSPVRASASTTCAGARRGERQPAEGHPRRAAPELHARDRRSALQGREFPAAHSRLQERRAGAALATSRTSSTAWRTRSSPAGPTTSAPSFSTSSASRARTSSRSPTG